MHETPHAHMQVQKHRSAQNKIGERTLGDTYDQHSVTVAQLHNYPPSCGNTTVSRKRQKLTSRTKCLKYNGFWNVVVCWKMRQVRNLMTTSVCFVPILANSMIMTYTILSRCGWEVTASRAGPFAH